MAAEDHELARIREAYAERDAAATGSLYSWLRPAYARSMHEMEWELLRGMRSAGVALEGARVLDIGCGSGYFLHRLLDLGAASGAGIDLMAHRVEAGRARYPTLDLRAGSATELPWEDGAFDLVTQFTCLSSVLDRGVRRAIVAEMLRVTRPGGWLLSFDMRPGSVPVRLVRRAIDLALRLRGSAPPAGGTPVEPVTVEELQGVTGTPPVLARPVIVHPVLEPIVGGSRLRGLAAGAVPALRSHRLVIFRR